MGTRPLHLNAALVLALAVAWAGAVPTVAWAQTSGVDARLDRIERLLESQGLAEVLLRLEAMQRELQELRGEVEQQGHALEQLRQRQRDLYLDTDRRLLQVERVQQEGGGAPGDAREPERRNPAGRSERGEPEASAEDVQQGQGINRGAGEQEAYQVAFDLLRELRYEQAIEAFGAFLQQYPRGRYAHMAQYWIAEAHYAQRRFPQSIDHYQALLENYPNSPKVPEALLKIGYSQYELGRGDEARKVVQALMQRHPGTTEAGQAEALLDQIRAR